MHASGHGACLKTMSKTTTIQGFTLAAICLLLIHQGGFPMT